jgi:ABC-type multidrug transport system permease subunit
LHPRMILTIFRKDVRDVIRDSRVIVALLVPLGIGLFYNFLFDDDFDLPPVEVAYFAEDASELPARLQATVDGVVRLQLIELDSAAAVRARVVDEDANIGIVIPAGFDSAVQANESPALDLYIRDQPGTGTNFVLAALEQSLRVLADRAPPAVLQVDVITADEMATNIFDEIGPRQYFLLVAVIMLVGMNSMLVVPLILAEEAEKKTLDALVMVASYADVVAAKALVGLFYVGVSAVALVGLTGLAPEDPGLFVITVVLFALSLIGIGLLIGSMFTNANQVNTWAGFFLLPVIAPAFMVGFPFPDAVDTVLSGISTSQAMRLLINALSGQAVFPNVGLSIMVLLVWIVVAYGLLVLRLSRRQA